MAEFCLDCINEYEVKGDEKLTAEDVKIEYGLCEYCGEYNKPCVIRIKRKALHTLIGEVPISLLEYIKIKIRGY